MKCEGCNTERVYDDDFTIDNAREDVLDDGNVLCDYCWASHVQHTTNDVMCIVWSVYDVLLHIPRLTKEQGRAVLHEADRTHDAEYGIAWGTFDIIADEMFPVVSE